MAGKMEAVNRSFHSMILNLIELCRCSVKMLMQFYGGVCYLLQMSLFCGILHECGADLNFCLPEQMDSLIRELRNHLLNESPDARLGASLREALLQCIELHSSGYKLKEEAKDFYFNRQRNYNIRLITCASFDNFDKHLYVHVI